MKWITSCLVATSVLGCSASRELVSPAPEWVAQLRQAACEHHVRCEADFGPFAMRYQSYCHPASDFSIAYMRRAARAGSTFDLDEERAQRCLDAIAHADCRLWPYYADDPDLYLCSRAFEGHVEEGGLCDPTLFEDCVEGTYCASTDGACGGACMVLPGLGEPCTANYQCADDIRCDLGSDGPRCVERTGLPVVTVGEPCGAGVADCFDDAECRDGACMPRALAAPGAPCTGVSDCGPDAPYCAGPKGDRRCTSEATGALCDTGPLGDLPFQAVDSCPDSHRCAPGGCAPLIAAGAPCDDLPLCANGSRCVAGRCVAVVLPGAPCDGDAVCPLTHACLAGACAPLPALGEACDGSCFEGGCRGGICQLLPAGEPCNGFDEGWVNRCVGRCDGGTCGPADDAALGEPCGFGYSSCMPDLVCVARPDGSGVCAALCSG